MNKIETKLSLLVKGFQPEQYGKTDTPSLKTTGFSYINNAFQIQDRFWEWETGVGLFGIWKLFSFTKDQKYLDLLTDYYDERIAKGLPGKNVNTMAPILALTYVAEYTGRVDYLEICKTWTDWLMTGGLPRTQEGGFQHRTSESLNDGELWDDTLMMSVLCLANMGRILKKPELTEEASYQFLLHAKYLCDPSTGLWYHGFTFHGRHNFSKAFWGRGNCWITIAIPLFLEIADLEPSVQRYLSELLKSQIEAISSYQDPSGMWHTLLDDPLSYLESSATCGFGYGILRATELGIVPKTYVANALKALKPILDRIGIDGIVQDVSIGTPMGKTGKEFYRKIPLGPMPYGQSLAMLFLIETLRQGKENPEIKPYIC
jgi:unsaturated rhamnogalacturonyl hydrolase